MLAKKRLFLFIILVGGTAVLGSYVLGASSTSRVGTQVLWGGVPVSIQPFYTVGMFFGAAGFFAFTYFLLFRLDPQAVNIAGRFGFGWFNFLYLLILVPSALWMPLTILAIEQSGRIFLWLVRVDLWMVAAASLALFLALLKVAPRQPSTSQRLAVLGAIVFCVQTVLLDALAWVIYFRI